MFAPQATNRIPSLMRALVLESFDNPFALKEVEKPALQAGEVLVQVKAAALNRRDWWITRGKYAGIKYPSIIGSDGAGVVAEIGEGVDPKWLGKEVIINPGDKWGDDPNCQSKDFNILGLPDNGTFAEYVKISDRRLYRKPQYLTWEQTAAIPVAGLTAYRALFTKGKAVKGNTVLIVGVGSGTGAIALQLALAAGCKVYVTSGSTEKLDIARKMGATDGVIYKDADWDEHLKAMSGGFDVIIDSALGEGFAKLPDICKPGARIVFFGGTAGDIPPTNGRKIFWKQLQILGTTLGTQEEFEAMVDFIEEHHIIPVVDAVFPLEDAKSAFQKMDNSTQFGKIVIKM